MKNVFSIALILLSIAQFAFSQSAITISKSGKENPVFFLPGFTAPGSVWQPTVDHLDGQFESYLVSYAGFNGLAPIDTPWYATIKNQLIDYIKKEKLSDLTLIGHSMGGNLAIDIAVALPDRVKKLILVESIPCMRALMMPGIPASSLQYNSPYNQQILDMSEENFRNMVTGISQNMATDPSKTDTLINWSMKADRKTYVYGYTDLLKLDLRDELSEIKAKTLILGAGASYPDKAQVLANYESQYANLNAKQIFISDKSKHFIMFDQPAWFYKKINDFLNQNGL